MMVFLGQFVDQFAASHMRGQCKTILRQEFQRTVDGGFRQSGLVAARPLEDFGGREMSARVRAGCAESPSAGESCESRARVVFRSGRSRRSLEFLIARSCNNSTTKRSLAAGLSYLPRGEKFQFVYRRFILARIVRTLFSSSPPLFWRWFQSLPRDWQWLQ